MRIRVAGCFLFLLAASDAFGQNTNVRFLAKLDQHGYYNDVWGYSAVGKELAILGTDLGTAFVDATNPKSPVQVKFIPGPSSIWRDVDTWGDYCYIVTEGGSGVQIVDLSNPANPTLVKTWGATTVDHAHTISIDRTAGIAYVNGTGAGMRILSLADPLNPALVATYTASYVHDAFAQEGLALLASISAGKLRTMDASVLPSFPQLDSITTPGAFTHNVWANADNTVCATTDENSTGHLAFYDISDPTDIQLLSEFTTGTGSIVHNVYIRDTIAYCSWYTDGFVAVDMADPTSPEKIANYDTDLGPSGGYNGAWSCYPFQPSGAIYVSDQSTGLYILEVKCFPAVHYGAGLAGSGGFTPAVGTANGYASIGNSAFALTAGSLLGGASGGFVVGFGRASVPLLGGTLLVDVFGGPYFLLNFTATGVDPGAGSSSVTVPIPNSPSLVDLVVDVQAFQLDPGAPAGVSFSDGLEFVVCDPN